MSEATETKEGQGTEEGELDSDADRTAFSKTPKNKRPRRQTRSQTRQSQPRQSQSPKKDLTTTVESDIIDMVDSIDIEPVGILQQEGKKKKSSGPTKYTKRKRNDVTYLPRAHNATSYEATWSELDKKRLLIALQRFGILEIDQLIKSVPGKSEDDIRLFISKRWKAARTELRTHLKEVRKSKGENSRYLGPVDKWLEMLAKFYPNYDHYKTNPIAHAVLLIWKYEKHPDPSECGGVDFKALYEYMYYMLCGYPPKHLNQPTAAYLAETLKNFAYRIKSGNWTEEMDLLNSPLKINSEHRPPVTEDDVIAALSYTKEQCVEELSKLPGFNPFSIPERLLKMKEPPSVENKSVATATSTTAVINTTTATSTKVNVSGLSKK